MPPTMKEDLKAIPDELRATHRDAERKLAETADEHPVVREALDLKLLLLAAVVALAVAFVLRLVGLAFTLSLLVFLVLFLGGWLGLSRLSAPRRQTEPSES